MADLSGLIRVRKHTVEQKQKVVAELYRQVEGLLSQKTDLLDNLKLEEEKLKDLQVEMLSYFGPYSEAVKGRVEEIDKKNKILEKRIQIAQEDMRAAYSELKKVEITQRQREAEEAKQIAKKESDELDAIAIDGFRRKTQED